MSRCIDPERLNAAHDAIKSGIPVERVAEQLGLPEDELCKLLGLPQWKRETARLNLFGQSAPEHISER